MKKIKSYIFIAFLLSGSLSIQAMLSRLSRIPQSQQIPRRNLSGLGKPKVRPSLLPAAGVNQNMQQNPFVKSPESQLNSPSNSLFQSIQKQYQASPISSLVTSLAWTAALGLLPFGIVIIDVDKMFDGLRSIRQKIEPFFIAPKFPVDTKAEQELKSLSDSDKNKQDEVAKE